MTTAKQKSRLQDIPAVSVKVSKCQLEALELKYELYSRLCDSDERILDCMTLSRDDCIEVGRLIDMNPEEFAGQYAIMSVS